MTWVATAIIGSAVVGAAATSSAARRASRPQAQAGADAIDEERRQYDTTRSDLAPWREAGTSALQRLQGFSEQDFWDDPITKLSFQAGLDEGRRALHARAPLTTGRDSGAALKELTRFAGDYTASRAGDSYNRIAQLAGFGLPAATTTAQAGQQSAGNIANIITGMGNARGASQIAQGNAWTGALGNVSNWWQRNQENQMQQNMWNQLLAQRGGMGGMSSTPYTGSFGWGNT